MPSLLVVRSTGGRLAAAAPARSGRGVVLRRSHSAAQRRALRPAHGSPAAHQPRAALPQQQEDAEAASGVQPTAAKTGVAALVGTPAYLALEIGQLLIVLMLVDAGWSGDWSRIGAISKETELVLQKISLVPVLGHLVTAAAAGVVASRQGKSPLLPAVKGYFFGALGLYEVQHTP